MRIRVRVIDKLVELEGDEKALRSWAKPLIEQATLPVPEGRVALEGEVFGRPMCFWVKPHWVKPFLLRFTTPGVKRVKNSECKDCGEKKLPKRAADEVVAKRREICFSCDKFTYNDGWRYCVECGCNLEQKELMANAPCPLGKW